MFTASIKHESGLETPLGLFEDAPTLIHGIHVPLMRQFSRWITYSNGSYFEVNPDNMGTGLFLSEIDVADGFRYDFGDFAFLIDRFRRGGVTPMVKNIGSNANNGGSVRCPSCDQLVQPLTGLRNEVRLEEFHLSITLHKCPQHGEFESYLVLKR
ncbi:MAG: hypothetical protein SGJ05_01800 [bacterium]|nr:hypothetical protein [bacterium]